MSPDPSLPAGPASCKPGTDAADTGPDLVARPVTSDPPLRVVAGSRDDPWRPAFLAALLLAFASIVWGRMVDVHDGPVLCPTRLVSGVNCPGCGLSRSFVAMAELQPTLAFAMHPVGPALFLWVWAIAFHGLVERTLGTRVRGIALQRAFAMISVALLAAFLVHAALMVLDSAR